MECQSIRARRATSGRKLHLNCRDWYPGVQYSEAARFWNCEALNVNPLPGYGCMERVRIAGLRLTGPPSSRQLSDGVGTSVPHNELPHCRERRAHSRPVLDLRLADRM